MNLTLAVDADILRDARKIAIDEDTSVSALVREFLADLVESRKRKHRSQLADELFAYADGLFGRGSGLARCRQFGSVGGNCAFEATFDMKGDAIASAALHYTTDLGETRKREWKSIPATVTGDAVHAVPPPGTTSLFLGIETERGLRVTSDTFFGKVPTGGLERQSLQGLETMNVV